jgi:hypothetical protein
VEALTGRTASMVSFRLVVSVTLIKDLLKATVKDQLLCLAKHISKSYGFKLLSSKYWISAQYIWTNLKNSTIMDKIAKMFFFFYYV